MKRYCLALDLKNDRHLIEEYERYHRAVWPEIKDSLYQSGILQMEIYRLDTRLFMMIETSAEFSFERKASMDQANQKVQEWESIMWNFQQPLPGSAPGEKWRLMEKVFSLTGN
jgi:L-rhamnose mutarotase